MSNTYRISGTSQISSTDLTSTVNLGLAYTTTGSNAIAISQVITVGSWQPLITSSLSNIRLFVASNEGTASIKIAKDSAGSTIYGVLQRGDPIVMPLSGSVGANTFFAQALISSSVLKYHLGEL